MEDTKQLEKTIKVAFKEKALLTEALTHRSYVNEFGNSTTVHNERLEFLGDAVLELVVTEFLFNKYKDFPEGRLTSLRSALVRTESLAAEAMKIELGKYMLMSKGEESSGGRNRPYILANAFEALIGAIYADSNYKKAYEFIITHVCYKIDEIVENKLDIDAKSQLQEISQDTLKITPTYKLISEEGPDHNKSFRMGVQIGDFIFTKGNGESKQAAEQEAAKKALENWKSLVNKYFGLKT